VLEDARTNAGDKEDPELLQEGVAVQGPGQHLLRGDEDGSRVSGSRETAGRSSISMIRVGGSGDIRGWRGRGEGENLGFSCS
jgi:hypothetical protein